MQIQNNSYVLGLDIGIASVGWALLDNTHIINLGVRAFDKAETAKEGNSLNSARRQARLTRHRLQNRVLRLTKLTRTLKRHGLIPDKKFFKETYYRPSLWQLRVEGLDRLLSDEEWARVIYHICKHRGFYWRSRSEELKAEQDQTGEGGKVKTGLASTQKLMTDKHYRSAAEMILAEFPEAQRNKTGNYQKSLSRILLGQELLLLFEKQRHFGNTQANLGLQEEILGCGDNKSGLFWLQKPALSGTALINMLGKCTFEKTEYRAPKSSFTAERHVWLTILNNLRIVTEGVTRALNEQERKIALPLPYIKEKDFTYKQLRTALVKAGLITNNFRFIGLRPPEESGNKQEPENQKLVKLSGWQALRECFKRHGLKTEWEGLASKAIEGHPEKLDQIAWVLSIYKEDDELEQNLRDLSLPGGEKTIHALLELSFDKFHALSLKSLYRIVPLMEKGLRYDEAIAAIPEYEHHSQFKEDENIRQKYLPPLYSGRAKDGRMIFNQALDIPRNPVVLRALNQARKVVNSIIRQYGSPNAIHIEMARDLSRPLDERRSIEKKQSDYREQNNKNRNRFLEHFDKEPKKNDFLKWRLYSEQQGKCPYSGKEIDLHQLLIPGYVEIDHALPYSRSFDDSKNNKVLVLSKENQEKGNRTPYEYLDGKNDSPRWRLFKSFVENNKAYRHAKQNLLLKTDFDEKEANKFRERNLNDTRYICRFFKNYIERYLMLAEPEKSKRCVVVSGALTSFLRTRWGLLKNRTENDRHHALDATVIAAASHAMVKRLSDYSRRKELEKVRTGFIDLTTGEIINPLKLLQLEKFFPEPWPHFRQELEIRLKNDDPLVLRNQIKQFETYSTEEIERLNPLFVSRSVKRRSRGEIHKAKIFSIKNESINKAIEKTPLINLTLSKLDKMVGKNDPRNKDLYGILFERLSSSKNDPQKAFGPLQPKIFRPSAKGKQAPEVRSIRTEITQNSGLFVRGGIADLGEMLSIDIFHHKNNFIVIPRYQAKIEKMRKEIILPEDAHYYFNLTKNDLVEITTKTEKILGYFVMYESDGRITLRAHDQTQPDKKFFRKSILKAVQVKKFNVDVLGNIYPIVPESYHGVA